MLKSYFKLVIRNFAMCCISAPKADTVVYWLWPKGCIVSCQYRIFLSQTQGSSTLKEKRLQMPGAAQGCIREADGLGKDILTSAIPL